MKLIKLTKLALGFAATANALAATVNDSLQVIQPPVTSSADAQFHAFGLTVTEYCDGNDKKAKGVWNSYGFSTEIQLSKLAIVFIQLGRGINLNIEWDAANSWVNFYYGSCKWGLYEFKSCGWCRGSGWSSGPLHCDTGSVGASRTYTTNCIINMDAQNGANEVVQAGTKFITARKETDDVPPTTTVTQSYEPLPTAAPISHAGPIGIYPFTLKVTEYCEASQGTPRKAKGYFWAGSGGYMHYFGSNRAASINLGYAGVNLIIGPYSYWTRTVQFQYGDCVWSETMMKQCGWCKERETWQPSSPINCAAGNQEPRTHTLNCNVVVDWGNTAHDDPKPIAARELSTTIADVEADALKPSKTLSVIPQISKTSTTATPAVETWILPFHFQATEYCEDGAKKAKGVYSNGNVVADVNLRPGLRTGIDHRVPGYPPFYVGPFDYNASKVKYSYTNGVIGCEWSDDENWKQCGECRAARWSASELSCKSGGSRVKEMDCSFILGVVSS
ncbi:uncharacterized protein K460DRAFT_413918 [Cucurbitaria berberidis CBS 394.84]|uniref:Uncharacterized protein n=1 Tax=Cucurbitaria berberidis CBS 394.84 TaxID=1168544 RepID=A0A9P4L9K3_9PLEO|nr:uncharacterized protein K460DRAFT_413918 [Cucurbitaria berberidis CBS 394.84]KAF1847115.1 hypothetical protein K460DRAFT_413918 [Cucurbitaria berberidis CBS 394.84]